MIYIRKKKIINMRNQKNEKYSFKESYDCIPAFINQNENEVKSIESNVRGYDERIENLKAKLKLNNSN